MKPSVKKVLKSGFFLLLLTLILLYPHFSLYYAATGLSLWFDRMVPVLFPFMLLSTIMIRQNLTEDFAGILYPILGPLFRISRNCVYCILLGFLCGFPMGAKVIAQLYERKKLNHREAEFLLAFCNNIGPVYFLGFLLPTIGVYRTGKVPIFLLGMYGIPLLYGLFLRFTGFLLPSGHFKMWGNKAIKKAENTEPFTLSLEGAMQSSIAGITTLGGYMILFNLLNLIPHALSLLFSNVEGELLLSSINCMVEITSGISRIGSSFPLIVLILLPIGGLSCIAQTASVLKDTNLSMSRYLIHKTIQTGLTASYYLFFRFFLF